ncbi:MAG: 2-hydroxyacid dehydrogenase [Dehalococcoidia bacterium]
MVNDTQIKKITVIDDYPTILSDSYEFSKLRKFANYNLVINRTRPKSQNEILEICADSDTIVISHTSTIIDNPLLESVSEDLKHIAIWGTAMDHVNIISAKRLGIAVSNTKNSSTISVAEHALAMLLTTAKKIPQMDTRMRGGEWPSSQQIQLKGKTLGIIGSGPVGIRLAKIASGIGMKIIIYPINDQTRENLVSDKSFKWKIVSLNELLEESDAVSLHTRYNNQTNKLLSSNEFSKMKPNSILINTARSKIIDTNALIEALVNQTIGAAALDVFDDEPLGKNNKLLQIDNLVLTPACCIKYD